MLYRLYLAEKLKEPFRSTARRNLGDPATAATRVAAREAARLEQEQVGGGEGGGGWGKGRGEVRKGRGRYLWTSSLERMITWCARRGGR